MEIGSTGSINNVLQQGIQPEAAIQQQNLSNEQNQLQAIEQDNNTTAPQAGADQRIGGNVNVVV